MLIGYFEECLEIIAYVEAVPFLARWRCSKLVCVCVLYSPIFFEDLWWWGGLSTAGAAQIDLKGLDGEI